MTTRHVLALIDEFIISYRNDDIILGKYTDLPPAWLLRFIKLIESKGDMHAKCMSPVIERLKSIFCFEIEPPIATSPYLSSMDDILRLSVEIRGLLKLINNLNDLIVEKIRKFPFYREYSRIYAKLTCEDLLAPLREQAFEILNTKKAALHAHYTIKSREAVSLQAAFATRINYQDLCGGGVYFKPLSPKHTRGSRALETKTPPMGQWVRDVCRESQNMTEEELYELEHRGSEKDESRHEAKRMRVFENMKPPVFREDDINGMRYK
jgi:hypothetical protein